MKIMTVYDYLKKHNLTHQELDELLGVRKGYIGAFLNSTGVVTTKAKNILRRVGIDDFSRERGNKVQDLEDFRNAVIYYLETKKLKVYELGELSDVLPVNIYKFINRTTGISVENKRKLMTVGVPEKAPSEWRHKPINSEPGMNDEVTYKAVEVMRNISLLKRGVVFIHDKRVFNYIQFWLRDRNYDFTYQVINGEYTVSFKKPKEEQK